jgi:hypothetical protein
MRPLSPPFPQNSAARRSGFALLITITLLAFLVLILVSLASLTRVETQVASNSQHLVQARQNALLSLNIAVGQLQKYLGPDQRTTARADLDASLAATTTANGRWLGAYGSRVSADYTDTPDEIADALAAAYTAAGADPLARKGSQAIRLNWLVSGNENTAFNPLADVAADGHITRAAAPSIRYNPDPSTNPTVSTINLDTVNTLPTPSDTSVLLVGPASVATIHDRVAAPLVEITVPENSLPGLNAASTTATPVGRYAWWVGDENAKARVNLASLAPPAIDPAHAFVVAQRTAVELVDGVNASGTTPAFNPAHLIGTDAYDPAAPAIRELLRTDQLPFLSSAHITALEDARKKRFHDLTASSLSVLSDTYAGGLRKDLSALLATGAAAPADTDYLFTPQGSSATETFGIPTWGRLRSFARQTANGSALTPRLPTTTDVGIAPVLTFIEAGLEYYQPTPGSIRVAVFPRVVLWNPYSSPLAPARYEVGVSTATGPFQLQGKVPPGAWTAKELTQRLSKGAGTTPSSVANGYLRFIVNVSAQIPPGESHVFVIQGAQNAQPYAAPHSGAATNELTQGVLPGYVILPDTGLTAAPTEIFRVAGDGPSHIATPALNIPFRNHASAYLGEVPTAGPDGPAWPAAGKPWYQVTGKAAVSGSPAYPWLQGGANDADCDALMSTPGTRQWGVQVKHTFTTRVRYIANTNPRASFRASSPLIISRGVISFQGTDLSPNDFDPSSDARASAATGLDVVADDPVDNTLFEFRPAAQPLLSLGQLQHANLSFLMDWPAYPLGNSAAPYIFLNADNATRDRLYRAGSDATPPINLLSGLYDISYLLNRALWDRYFVSTVPHAGTNAAGVTALPDVLPNARLVRPALGSAGEATDLADADKAAARLLLAGGFNINSTSEQAWRAVLGGLNQLAHEAGGTLDAPLDAAFPRFTRPPAAIPLSGTRTDWAFTGYRRLTAEQIAGLASEIVAEVRNRGPFISLADFINRRLKDNPDTVTPVSGIKYNANEAVKGPLQNAIDRSPVAGAASVNNSRAVAPFNSSGGSIDAAGVLDPDAMRGGPAVTGNTPQHPYGSVAAFTPQFLTQADVLSAIGPTLSARSDTFTVRAYGDTRNPVTGEITGRAWCEAVVQRTVEPVVRKSADPASSDYNEPAAAIGTQPDFGRRFQIISFRWLSPSDL